MLPRKGSDDFNWRELGGRPDQCTFQCRVITTSATETPCRVFSWRQIAESRSEDESTWTRALDCSRHLSFRCPGINEGRLVCLGLGANGGPAAAMCLEKLKLPAGRVLHIDHLFARMQRLNTYEAKTNAMTRVGSNLSQALPSPFSCE